MSEPIELTSIEFVEIPATVRTTWVMAHLREAGGEGTWVEVVGDVKQPSVETCTELAAAVATLARRPIVDEAAVPSMLGLTDTDLCGDFIRATAVSSLRSAVSQLQAARAGQSLTEAVGGAPQDSVQLYGNINRSLLDDRTPAAHAAAASATMERWDFEIIKCAPFDEVRAKPGDRSSDILDSAAPGIARICAAIDAVGDGVRVLVDCHSRFDEASALAIGEKLAELGVSWFEEAVDPGTQVEALARIAAATRLPMAGGEGLYGKDRFENLLSTGAVETIMPDVKHCGGVAEAVRAGRAVAAVGGTISLHSPSGPLSLLASAHATAAVDGALALEHAVDEVDWRAELLVPAEQIRQGRLWIPAGPGLGASLDEDTIPRRGRRWKP